MASAPDPTEKLIADLDQKRARCGGNENPSEYMLVSAPQYDALRAALREKREHDEPLIAALGNDLDAAQSRVAELDFLDREYTECENCHGRFPGKIGMTDDGEQTCCAGCRASDERDAGLKELKRMRDYLSADNVKRIDEDLAAASALLGADDKLSAALSRVKGLTKPADEDGREFLGRMVRMVWVEWALEQDNPKPAWVAPWGDLSEPMREVDRRIGERVASVAVPLWGEAQSRVAELEAQIQEMQR